MIVRNKIKRIAARIGAFMMISTAFIHVMGIQAHAEIKDVHSDTVYFVTDGSEQKDRNFSITYDITSGHELMNITPVEKTGVRADMKAKAGDTITIAYKVNYPHDTEYNTYSNMSVRLGADSTTYTDGFESEDTQLVDEKISANDGSTGVLKFDIPKDSNLVTCIIQSSYDFVYAVAGTEMNRGTSQVSLIINVEVDGASEIQEDTEVPFVEEKVEQHAKEDAGEDAGTEISQEIVEKPDDDKGTDIPLAVPVAVGGAIVGAGIIGAGGGNKGSGDQSQDDDKKRKKRYKMFIAKDFGDGIRKGANPVQVRARIMEIRTDESRVSRPDLTERISVSGENIKVGSVSMSGGWIRAEIYADKDALGSEGTVIFNFTGEGGVFRNRIVFRLTGQPYIVYPDSDLTSTEMVLKMISGDTNPYSVRFFFEDATGEPTKLRLSGDDRFQTKLREAENVRTYYADVIMESSDPIESYYTKPERAYIDIHAEFENGDIVDGGFYVEIWPEGISVTSRYVKDDRLMIDTVPDPNAGDLDYVIRPTAFEVRVCYRDIGADEPVFLMGEDLKPQFSDLYQVERYGKTFTDNFRFKIDTEFNEYGFEPQDTLPMLTDPYEVMIDISCDVGEKTYKKSLPLGFYGEKPLLPSNAEWQAVYKKLKRDVEIFGVGSDPDIKVMLKNARTASAADLEYLRYWIILSGTLFYESQSREYTKIDKVMTNYIVVASAFVKIGDKAVEMAIKIKWPTADAALIAAFVNPWKNAMAQFIGQYVAKFSLIDLSEGDPEDFEFIKTLLSSCEDTLSEIITGDGRMIDPKVMGQIVSLYLMICFAKHYFYGEGNEKGDIFKSTIEALKDLTLTKLKSFFKGLLDKGGDYLGKVTDFVCKHLGNTFKYVGLGKAEELARLAYEHQVRMAMQNQGSLSNAAYDAAKKFSMEVKEMYLSAAGKRISEYESATFQWIAKYVVGFILNYLAKGTKENDSLGVETNEVIVEWVNDRSDVLLKKLADALKKRYGLDVEKYYMDASAALDISVRLNGEYLIMKFCGYTVEINIAENAEALFGIAYEICFGWMEDLWKSMQSQDPNWDPRDDLSDDTTMVERMAERVRDLGSSGDIRYTGT